MDRRHRPFLGLLLAGGMVVLPLAGRLRAQEATPGATASPAVSATPWVQASPPPGTPAAPKPADIPHPPKPAKSPKPAVAPLATPSQEEMMREMMRRRAEEKRAEDKDAEAHRHPDAARELSPPKDDTPTPKEAVRLDQIPPDERAAYQRNLPLWRQLPEDERNDLRRRADERAKQEIDKAYQDSGLNLDHDQREVFNLRYRQERRKVERELQEKANVERTRRLAEVSDRLKHEFTGKTMPAGTPPAPDASATPAPKKAVPKSAATPDSSATPLPGFMR